MLKRLEKRRDANSACNLRKKDRYRRQRRENAGSRLISQPDMESKHPIIAAARLK